MNLKRRSALVVAALFCGLFMAADAAAQARVAAPVRVGRYRLQSNPWVNLHQRLVYEARFKWDKPPAGLSGEDLAKWAKAVEDYRAYLGRRNPIFDEELKRLNATLSGTNADRLPGTIPAASARRSKHTGRRTSTASSHARRPSSRLWSRPRPRRSNLRRTDARGSQNCKAQI